MSKEFVESLAKDAAQQRTCPDHTRSEVLLELKIPEDNQ
jgi:hypothetical protein